MSETPQPKILRKSLLRIAYWLLFLAALIFGYQKLRQIGVDPVGFLGGGDTTGYIATMQETNSGAKAVVIKPDGTIVEAPGYHEDVIDHDLAWPSDGRFLYFVSDRESSQSHVFRWNVTGDHVERKTLDKRTKGATWFPPSSFPEANDFGLVVSGGNVLQLNPKTGEARQLLPPIAKNVSGGAEEGAGSQFDALYSRLGTSFRLAKWGKDKAWIAATMRRESGGEVLIVQDSEGKEVPTAIVAGDHVDFDVSPTENKLVYIVQGFEFPDLENVPKEFIKNGKVVRPFRNGVGVFDPAEPKNSGPIGLNTDDTVVFGEPRISPDGSTLLLVVGSLNKDGKFIRGGVASLPAQPGGMSSAARLMEGVAYNPTWSADGSQVIFVKEEGGKRAVFSVNKDGSNPKNLTGVKGDFSTPIMSPAKKN